MKNLTKELLYKSAYRRIFYHPDKKMLEMSYLSGTTNYTDDEYKEEEIILRDFLAEKDVEFCYTDTVDFDYIIIPEIQEWVKEVAKPVLKEGKLKKIAVLISKQVFSKVSVTQMADKFTKDESTVCQIRHFATKQDAMEWLLT